eukprot:9817469-Alexandrium_andersonii.AAC.1
MCIRDSVPAGGRSPFRTEERPLPKFSQLLVQNGSLPSPKETLFNPQDPHESDWEHRPFGIYL